VAKRAAVAPRRTSPTPAVAGIARPALRRPRGRVAAAVLPSARALLIALAVVVAGAGVYATARATSFFAVRTFDVRGASPDTARAVREALASSEGTSLLSLDRAALVGRVEDIPMVAGAELDRAFPHTLVVFVREEQPAVVLRRGSEAWLVAASGRVLDRSARGTHPSLPRVWVAKSTSVTLGRELADARVATAVGAVARLPPGFPDRVRDVRSAAGELTFRLASGIELRLGDGRELGLKLAIASRILPQLTPDAAASEHYLDVSVVERPVSGGTLNSEVEVEG
jgi:cell division protein FtsQ